MITMQNWRVNVPPGDGMLGYETETGVARLAIQLDGEYPGWQFKLDTRREYQELNVFDFVHEGDRIYFDVTDELGLEAGRYMCQVRGESEGKRQLSNTFCLYVGESIGAITVLERVPVAELYQLEQRLTAIKSTCEELTRTSTDAASDAAESMRTALGAAEQAVASAGQAVALLEATDAAAAAATRDAETSAAARQAAEAAKADAEAAQVAAETALQSAQAALDAAQTAAKSAEANKFITETARDEAVNAGNRAQAAADNANAVADMIVNSRFEVSTDGHLMWSY